MRKKLESDKIAEGFMKVKFRSQAELMPIEHYETCFLNNQVKKSVSRSRKCFKSVIQHYNEQIAGGKNNRKQFLIIKA